MAELTPERMMSKALIKLTTNDPFFGCVAMRLEVEAITPAFAEDFKKNNKFEFSMSTNGKSIRYNPEWVSRQQLNDLVGVLAHEAAHVALKHHLRRGQRHLMKWNTACDMAINSHLLEAGYSLPDYDDAAKAKAKQYIDMSSEKIYGLIPDGGPGGPPDPNQPPPDPNQPPPTGGDQWAQSPQTPGGVLDHPEMDPKNINKQRDLEEEADGNIEAAYQAAKSTGVVPGWMDKVIRGRRRVINDYRELLRDWMEKSLYKGNYSWACPNRRYIGSGFCLPGFAPEDDQPNFVFAMDTSGSITKEEEEEFASHINSVLEEFPSSYTVIYTDTKVRNIQTVSFEELPVELKTKGGGGTDFRDIMKVIKEKYVQSDTPPQGVIFFTDLGTNAFGDDPGIPVLWLVHSNTDESMEVPFGKTVVCKSKKQLAEEKAE